MLYRRATARSNRPWRTVAAVCPSLRSDGMHLCIWKEGFRACVRSCVCIRHAHSAALGGSRRLRRGKRTSTARRTTKCSTWWPRPRRSTTHVQITTRSCCLSRSSRLLHSTTYRNASKHAYYVRDDERAVRLQRRPILPSASSRPAVRSWSQTTTVCPHKTAMLEIIATCYCKSPPLPRQTDQGVQTNKQTDHAHQTRTVANEPRTVSHSIVGAHCVLRSLLRQARRRGVSSRSGGRATRRRSRARGLRPGRTLTRSTASVTLTCRFGSRL